MSESVSKSVEHTSSFKVLLRLYWMAFGNIPIIFPPILIAKHSAVGFSLYDVITILALVLIVAVRYIDIYFYNGETADHQPATPAIFKSYAIRISSFTIAALALAHALAWLIAS